MYVSAKTLCSFFNFMLCKHCWSLDTKSTWLAENCLFNMKHVVEMLIRCVWNVQTYRWFAEPYNGNFLFWRLTSSTQAKVGQFPQITFKSAISCDTAVYILPKHSMLGVCVCVCVYHDIEVSALVSSFRRKQRGVVQQLFQQFCGFVKMLLLSTEQALSVHTQQGIYLTLITCREMKGRSHTDYKRR